MSDEVVVATHVVKRYGPMTALDGVDLCIHPGVVHGLIGPNGAGKTTLLSILFGLLSPEEGTVRLFGRTRGEARASWLDGVGGFVESPEFYPYLTGAENLRLLGGLDDPDTSDIAEKALSLVGLDDVERRKVSRYSLGMRQRLGIAAAVLRRPRLLILDEPTTGSTRRGRRRSWRRCGPSPTSG